MASPVDVGGLSNHVKYCVSVLSLQWANIRTSPVGIPYTCYHMPIHISCECYVNREIIARGEHINPIILNISKH